MRLIANVYQYKITNIILPNSTLSMPRPRNDVHFQISWFYFEITSSGKQTFCLASNNFRII